MSRFSLLFLALAAAAFAQPPAAAPKPPRAPGAKPAGAQRPPLFFKEEWKQTPAGGEHDMDQNSVGNPNLVLTHYGEYGHVLLTGVAGDESNPIHTWSGECEAACGFTLKHKENMVDLSGLGRIRVNTKASGFHGVRLMLKLADGTMLAADRTDGIFEDWINAEYLVRDLKWMKLDPKRMVTTGNLISNPDLTKVDEVGFIDLYAGSGHGAGGWSDVAQIEVYGKPVKR